MKIKLDPADIVFSQFIRLRDGRCRRCCSLVRINDKGLPVSHQNSHYFGRGMESTRFDPENCDTLCMACHRNWGSDGKEEYRNFKIHQLGEQGFKRLCVRAHTIGKKDRKMALIFAKHKLKTIFEDFLENKTK